MRGEIDIFMEPFPIRCVIGQSLRPLPVVSMNSARDGEAFLGEYVATITLLNARGQPVNYLLDGARTVDAEDCTDGQRLGWCFSWAGLSIREAGSYSLEVTVWEKADPKITGSRPCSMGSATQKEVIIDKPPRNA